MTESSRAIFLSYASQDAEAARRISDALSAAGLEVWFDQSGLRGGDAWDASIRRQIRECALFVPIISANTQSRTEGYFRLEWRMAEQRSHLMARGRPYLVPVVVDGTAEAGAHVPDAFLEVQWTRLPAGQCDATFTARLRQLLTDGIAAPRREAAPPPPRVAAASPRFPVRRAWIIAIVLLVALGAVIVKQSFDPSSWPADSASPATADDAAELVARARELMDDDPLRTRRNLELAEQFALEAIAMDPASAEASAAAAWVNYRFISRYDDTPQRRADLRSYAEKAKLLDPDSFNAELAACGLLAVNQDWDELLKRGGKLLERAPDDLTVLRLASAAAIGAAPDAETAAAVDSRVSAALDRLRGVSPLGRSYADSMLAGQHWRRGDYVEADRLLDGVFASGLPVRESYQLRLLVLLYGWGDLDATREFAATIPSQLLLEDVFIYHVFSLWMFAGEYDKALETLGRSQRDMLQESAITAPTASLRGNAHAAAGRPAAAELQWREALKTLDRLLEAKPASGELREQKATVLARLGEREAAAAEFALAHELNGSPAVGSIEWAGSYAYQVATGDHEGAIVRLDRLMQRDYGRWPGVYTRLRYDPTLRSLHGDPRVEAMLERGARWLEEKRSG